MKNDNEAKELWSKLQVSERVDVACENDIALKSVGEYFSYSSPVNIEEIETVASYEHTPESCLGSDEQTKTVDKNALAVFIYSNHFSDDLEDLRQSKGIAIGLKDSASALSLADGFMQTRYVVLHNKGELSVVYNTKGSPRLLMAKDVSEYFVVLKDCDFYIVFDMDMSRNNLDIKIDTRKLINDSDHKGYDSVIRPIRQYLL